MSHKRNFINFAAEVIIEAAAADTGGSPRFQALAYTGGRLPNAIKSGGNRVEADVIADLSGMTPAKSLVANLRHKDDQLVGHVDGVQNDGRQLVLSGAASCVTAFRDEVVGSAANGFKWQASIEASIDKLEFITAGKSVQVNGQSFNGPIYVARKTTLKGFAFVSHGADDNTSVSIAASSASLTEEPIMKSEIEAWAKSMGIDVANATPETIAVIEANYNGLNKKPEIKADAGLDGFAKIRAENERRDKIRKYAIEASQRHPHIIDAIEQMAESAIEASKPFDSFKLDLLDSLMPVAQTVSSPRIGNKKITKDVLEAAVCQAAGLKTIEAAFDDQTMQIAHDHFKGRLGLNRLFIEAARANGYKGDDLEVTHDIHNYAFRLQGGRPEIQASGMSTLNVSGILSNTANKFLMEGWLGQDMEWKKISAIRNVRDFKTVTSYKLSGTMKYKKVGATGELKHGTVSEDTYTNRAETYGITFAISRTDYINDDLNAFTQLPREAGYGANDAFNEVFWTEFLDNSAFFASGNNNVNTAVADMTIGGLAATETIFMNQTKPNGTPLGLTPKIILVPTALKRLALALMNSQLVVSGSTSGLPNGNTFQGNYDVVSSPYLSNSAFAGYSAAAWYMLADPSRLAAIETALLNGREAPFIEAADASFNVLGTQLRAYHDFGVNMQEYRAGVRADGGAS